MGSLVHAELCDVMASLEVLDKLGMVMEDLDQVRRYPGFARKVAELFNVRRRTFEMAIGGDEALAILAINAFEYEEPRFMAEIAKKAKLVKAACHATAKLPSHEIYHIARLHEDPVVVEFAVGLTSDNDLWSLRCGDGVKNVRRELVEAEYQRRQQRR